MLTTNEYLKINLDFYKAFENFNLEEMENIWAKVDEAVCIHPGWNILIGWESIRDSWTKIFENESLMKFTIRNPRVQLAVNSGIVTCIEEIFVTTNNTISQTFIASTNIFKKMNGKLKMVYHHSSPIFSSDRNLTLTYN